MPDQPATEIPGVGCVRRPPHRPPGRRAGDDARRRSATARWPSSSTRRCPAVIREAAPLALPDPLSETEALARLRELAGRNEVFTSLIGLGYHDTITPPVILRNVLENPAWYTAYTPYQPEISQGRLEALLNFQTMVSDLTGMDLANASLLDEGTAAAEAMAMLHRLNPKQGAVFLVDADAHPQTIDVVRTRAEPLGIEVVVGDPDDRSTRSTAASACSCSIRAAAAGCATSRPRSSARTRTARWCASRPTCSRSRSSRRRARWAPTRWSARPSASACRSGSAARTRRTSRCATSTGARCRAGSSACRSTRRAAPRSPRGLQSPGHGVERRPQAAQLRRPGVDHGPAGQVTVGQLARRAVQPGQRPAHPPGQRERQQRRGEHGHDRDRAEDDPQLNDVVVQRRRGPGQDHRAQQHVRVVVDGHGRDDP